MGRKTFRHYERHGRLVRFAYAACGAVILLVGVGLVIVKTDVDPFAVHAVGAVIAALGFFFGFRSLQLATIDVGPGTVVVHGLLTTSKLPVAEIERFLVVRDVASSSDRARILAVRTTNSKTIILEDFSNDGTDRGFSVEVLAAGLNADIRDRVPGSPRIGVA